MLKEFPRFAELWNRETREAKVDQIGRLVRGSILSTSERAALRVLFSIWCGRASKDTVIDFTDLGTLDARSRVQIVNWLANPFWP